MKINLNKIRNSFGLGRRPRNSDPDWDELADLSETMVVIDEFMRLHKPFLRSRYSLYQLARETDIPILDLSAIIDSNKYASFKDFIDHYRIDYCKQLLDQMPIKQLNLFDLTIICGFTDHREFSVAFKRNTHFTLSRYICNTCRERLSEKLSGARFCELEERRHGYSDMDSE